jgi:LPXTG-motif cell wall-anchored protein
MSVINRRNAVLGWAVWTVGKQTAKVKARAAVPRRSGDSMRPNKGAIATGVAALGGAVWFLRRRRSNNGAGPSSSDDVTTS